MVFGKMFPKKFLFFLERNYRFYLSENNDYHGLLFVHVIVIILKIKLNTYYIFNFIPKNYTVVEPCDAIPKL